MLPTAPAFLVATLAVASPDVVELRDGTRHPGESRTRKETVELVSPIGVMKFPAAEVARVERRNDLLPLYRSALEAAGTRAHALVTLSKWCLERGLYPEAFDCVDRAVAAAPQDPHVTEALGAIARDAVLDGAPPSEWPDVETRERLLDRVVGKSPSRAAFARALLLQAQDEELVPWLLGELEDLDVGVRAGAAALLGDVGGTRALGKLIRLSLVDGNSTVRDAARASALRSNHPDLASPYLRALETDDERIRMRAYPALAEIRDPRVVPALLAMFDPRPVQGGGSGGGALPRSHVSFGAQQAFVQDFDVEIAQGAVIAKPVIGVIQSGVVLDVTIAGVVVVSHVEKAAVVGALRRLSGESFGADKAAWSRWWESQGGRLPQPPVATASGDS
jgi:hypothetical protein